jgi:hypothetical protein
MKELFKDINGKLSIKRVMGTIIITSNLIMGFIDQLTTKDLNMVFFTTVFAGGIALLGIGVLEKENK